MKISAVGKSDVGIVREKNEDSLLIGKKVFVVSDGMGGYTAGEVASNYTVSIIEDELEKIPADIKPLKIEQHIINTIKKVNKEVRIKAASDEMYKSMGATVALLFAAKDKVVCGWVGDSRIYRLRQGELLMLTEDHQYAMDLLRLGQITEEEYKSHPDKYVISRAIGYKDTIEPEVRTIDTMEGDRFLLCSDGLTGFISNDMIKNAMNDISDSAQLVEKLIESAKANSSDDNITALIIDISSGPSVIKKTRILDAVPDIVEDAEIVKRKKKVYKIFLLILFVIILLAGGMFTFKYLEQRRDADKQTEEQEDLKNSRIQQENGTDKNQDSDKLDKTKKEEKVK